jgi:hypothetical protein
VFDVRRRKGMSSSKQLQALNLRMKLMKLAFRELLAWREDPQIACGLSLNAEALIVRILK